MGTTAAPATTAAATTAAATVAATTAAASGTTVAATTAAAPACSGNSTADAITCSAAQQAYTDATAVTEEANGLLGQISNVVSDISGVDVASVAKETFDAAVQNLDCTCSFPGSAFSLSISLVAVFIGLFVSL